MGASKSSVQYQARTHAGWPKSGTSPKTSLFTADELLGMGRHLNPGWDDPLARRRLTDLGLPLDKPVGLLSGGERAQVALALALGKHPRLLLLDEPVASLDPLARRDFLASWPPPVPNPISLLCSRPTWSPTSSASVTT
jgi:ABC-type hemin transport system ATPase subunit